MNTYESETVKAADAHLGPALQELVGKRIVSIESGDYQLMLRFEDGLLLKVDGHTYDGCSLRVEVMT